MAPRWSSNVEVHANGFNELAENVACLLVLIAPCGVSVSIPKKYTPQHGVKALDGGDANAADAVELRGLQVLDVVKLGELAAVVRCDELLELIRAAGAHPSGLSSDNVLSLLLQSLRVWSPRLPRSTRKRTRRAPASLMRR